MKRTVVGFFILLLVVFYAVFVGCPVYRLTGVPCPGCGMSRAFIAAAKLDFRAAFAYHPLFPVFAVETGYVLLRGNILKKVALAPKTELIVGLISLGLLMIVWIYRRFIINTI